jgi:NTP pyrophosphatase (non-canonical NTP hydrolase)
MRELQARIGAFDAGRFQSLGPGYLALSLAGEAGELANVVKKLWRLHPQIAAPEGFAAVGPEELGSIAGELADIVILSFVLAYHLGIAVEAEVVQKLEVIDQRLSSGYYGHEAQAREG